MEVPLFPANPAPVPRSNMSILVENSEAVLEESRNAILLPFQIAQFQETQEITAKDMVVRVSVIGQTRSGVSTAERAIFFYHTFLEYTTSDQSNVSQEAKSGRERVLDPKLKQERTTSSDDTSTGERLLLFLLFFTQLRTLAK